MGLGRVTPPVGRNTEAQEPRLAALFSMAQRDSRCSVNGSGFLMLAGNAFCGFHILSGLCHGVG